MQASAESTGSETIPYWLPRDFALGCKKLINITNTTLTTSTAYLWIL